MTAPTISNVSGTVSRGQTLTITGTSMVDEDKTNWRRHFTKFPNSYGFEGTSLLADGYGEPRLGGTYVTNVKLMGSKSVLWHVEGACATVENNRANYSYLEDGIPNLGELWVRFYARWKLNGGSWPISHIKMCDSQPDGGAGFAQMYLQPNADALETGLLPTQMVAVYDGKNRYAKIPSGRLQQDRWYGFEIHWKTDTRPFVFQAWMDGVQIFDETPTGAPFGDPAIGAVMIGVINACGTTSAFNLDHWWDGFAAGATRLRLASIVEIGNRANYATAKKVYQPPEFLSNTSSQVKADLTGLGAGPYWMWVTNNRNERSSAFSLSGIRTSDAAPLTLAAAMFGSRQVIDRREFFRRASGMFLPTGRGKL